MRLGIIDGRFTALDDIARGMGQHPVRLFPVSSTVTKHLFLDRMNSDSICYLILCQHCDPGSDNASFRTTKGNRLQSDAVRIHTASSAVPLRPCSSYQGLESHG